MKKHYSIIIEKEYLNFAASHFIIFGNGKREPLHGHNYYVRIKGHGNTLASDMLFDFLKIKPVARNICNNLDHKLLMPSENPNYSYNYTSTNIEITLPNGTFFSIPKEDVITLPIKNISAERLAEYIASQLISDLKTQFNFEFKKLEVEVEESKGQSASVIIEEE